MGCGGSFVISGLKVGSELFRLWESALDKGGKGGISGVIPMDSYSATMGLW